MASRSEVYWKQVLQAGTLGGIGSATWNVARKHLESIPASLSAREVKAIAALLVREHGSALYTGLRKLTDAHAASVAAGLRGSKDVEARTLAAAFRQGGPAAMRAVSEFLVFIGASTHWPGLQKRLKKVRVSSSVVAAALAMLAKPSGQDWMTARLPLWALTYAAARERPAILSAMAKSRDAEWREAAELVAASL